MTWEADIVDRAGRRSISGEFRLTSAAEAMKFIERLNYLVVSAQLDRTNEAVKRPTQSSEMANKDEPEVIVQYVDKSSPWKLRTRFPDQVPPGVKLHAGEIKVYELINSGMTPKQVAEKTGLSRATTYHYIDKIKEKISEARS